MVGWVDCHFIFVHPVVPCPCQSRHGPLVTWFVLRQAPQIFIWISNNAKLKNEHLSPLASKLFTLNRSNRWLTQASLILRLWLWQTNCNIFSLFFQRALWTLWCPWNQQTEKSTSGTLKSTSYYVEISTEIDMGIFCQRHRTLFLLLWSFCSVVFAQGEGKHWVKNCLLREDICSRYDFRFSHFSFP